VLRFKYDVELLNGKFITKGTEAKLIDYDPSKPTYTTSSAYIETKDDDQNVIHDWFTLSSLEQV
jgi:hypothetical protein